MAHYMCCFLFAALSLLVSVHGYQTEGHRHISLDKNAQRIIVSLAAQIFERQALDDQTTSFDMLQKRNLNDRIYNLPDKLMQKG